jgi:chromosomal replication initiation ATPase DnaA
MNTLIKKIEIEFFPMENKDIARLFKLMQDDKINMATIAYFDILDAACRIYDCDTEDLTSKSRAQPYVYYRHAVMAISYLYLVTTGYISGQQLEQITAIDRTSFYYSIKKIENLAFNKNDELAAMITAGYEKLKDLYLRKI